MELSGFHLVLGKRRIETGSPARVCVVLGEVRRDTSARQRRSRMRTEVVSSLLGYSGVCTSRFFDACTNMCTR